MDKMSLIDSNEKQENKVYEKPEYKEYCPLEFVGYYYYCGDYSNTYYYYY